MLEDSDVLNNFEDRVADALRGNFASCWILVWECLYSQDPFAEIEWLHLAERAMQVLVEADMESLDDEFSNESRGIDNAIILLGVLHYTGRGGFNKSLEEAKNLLIEVQHKTPQVWTLLIQLCRQGVGEPNQQPNEQLAKEYSDQLKRCIDAIINVKTVSATLQGGEISEFFNTTIRNNLGLEKLSLGDAIEEDSPKLMPGYCPPSHPRDFKLGDVRVLYELHKPVSLLGELLPRFEPRQNLYYRCWNELIRPDFFEIVTYLLGKVTSTDSRSLLVDYIARQDISDAFTQEEKRDLINTLISSGETPPSSELIASLSTCFEESFESESLDLGVPVRVRLNEQGAFIPNLPSPETQIELRERLDAYLNYLRLRDSLVDTQTNPIRIEEPSVLSFLDFYKKSPIREAIQRAWQLAILNRPTGFPLGLFSFLSSRSSVLAQNQPPEEYRLLQSCDSIALENDLAACVEQIIEFLRAKNTPLLAFSFADYLMKQLAQLIKSGYPDWVKQKLTLEEIRDRLCVELEVYYINTASVGVDDYQSYRY